MTKAGLVRLSNSDEYILLLAGWSPDFRLHLTELFNALAGRSSEDQKDQLYLSLNGFCQCHQFLGLRGNAPRLYAAFHRESHALTQADFLVGLALMDVRTAQKGGGQRDLELVKHARAQAILFYYCLGNPVVSPEIFHNMVQDALLAGATHQHRHGGLTAAQLVAKLNPAGAPLHQDVFFDFIITDQIPGCHSLLRHSFSA